jgi:hypothetical protein
VKHSTYHDGRVQSLRFERGGAEATVGVMEAGEYHFSTGAKERMTVIRGTLRAKLAGDGWRDYASGSAFEVPANSSFDVQAVGGSAAYLCEFFP